MNFSLSFSMELYIIFSQDWIGHPYYYVKQLDIVPMDSAIMYHLAISSYVYHCYRLIIEPRLKDFYQMMGHHLVTLTLLYGSYYIITSLNIGAVVLVLHDAADPFMEVAKMFFLYEQHDFRQFVFCFICFCVYCESIDIVSSVRFVSSLVLPAFSYSPASLLFLCFSDHHFCSGLLLVNPYYWDGQSNYQQRERPGRRSRERCVFEERMKESPFGICGGNVGLWKKERGEEKKKEERKKEERRKKKKGRLGSVFVVWVVVGASGNE